MVDKKQIPEKKTGIVNTKTFYGLTEAQKEVAKLVDSMPDSFDDKAVTEIIDENYESFLNKVPVIYNHPDNQYSYKWLDQDSRKTDLVGMGGHFLIVTRHNHAHIPGRMFHSHGAIDYRGELILGFTNKKIVEARNKRISERFDRNLIGNLFNSEANARGDKKFTVAPSSNEETKSFFDDGAHKEIKVLEK